MATIRSDITLIRGDDSSIAFHIDGVDLTGGTVFFTAKPLLDNETDDAAAVMEVSVSSFTDPTNGNATIPLSSTVTNVSPGDYFYDIQVKTAAGKIISIPARKLTVVQDVTRRTS